MALLQTIDLKRYFGETRAVDNVNLSIEEGEFVSLVGPNGAGKTSLINVISALLQAESGKIIFQRRGHHAAVRDASASRPASPAASSSSTCSTISPRSTTWRWRSSPARARPRIWARSPISTRRSIDEADAILGQFGLAAKRDDNARDLAQGERKLLDVALAYALKPKLLFLDEPTSGVSTRDKGQIMDTIASVVRGEGITAVIVEHDMDVVFKYSDRIVVMAQGAILAQGTPDEIRKNEQVAMVLLGTSGPDAFTRKD